MRTHVEEDAACTSSDIIEPDSASPLELAQLAPPPSSWVRRSALAKPNYEAECFGGGARLRLHALTAL